MMARSAMLEYATTLFVVAAAIQIFATKNTPLLLGPADALRMINLDVPQMAIQGDTVQLSCSYMLASENSGGGERANAIARYDLDESGDSGVGERPLSGGNRSTGRMSDSIDDRLSPRRSHKDDPGYKLADTRQTEFLYAIKWYKDEREFFRYVSQDWPHKQVLPMESLNIDVDKSDNQTVVLRNVSLKTSGMFRCEVSTDAPSFLTKSIERKVLIYSLPTEGPTIEPSSRLVRQTHYLGDHLELSCQSRESKPPVQLDWILNEQINLTSAMPQNLQAGPVFQVASKRLVRLASAPHKSADIAPEQVNTHTLESPNSSPRASYTTFAFEPTITDSSMVVAKSIGNSQRSQEVMLNVDNLNQLAEITMSKLNFTVDDNLIRLISESAGGGSEQARRVASDINWRTRKANLHAAPQARKASSAASESGKDRSKLPLRIRCVARVLHLKMSDDIKLVIVNRTRVPTTMAYGITTKQSHIRGNEEAANSAYANDLHCWLMFVLIASIEFGILRNVL